MNSYYERRAGATLMAAVETQLRDDLRHYRVDPDGLTIHWAEALGEGHDTWVLGGYLEKVSGLTVLDREGKTVAKGWMDFIHGGGEKDSFFVFWLYLSVRTGDGFIPVKQESTIPAHVWERLPEETKERCTREGEYDSRWSKDPRVRAWKQRHV